MRRSAASRTVLSGLGLFGATFVGIALGVGCGGDDGAGSSPSPDASTSEGGGAGDGGSSVGDGAADGAAGDGASSDTGPTHQAILSLASTGGHACAVVADGRVFCWGDNQEGDLGDGTTMPRNKPVEVPGLTGATAVSVSALHTCAIVSGGAVACWGNDYAGVLGDGMTTRSLVPKMVAGVTGAKAITTGPGHTCAILTSGAMMCWGSNQYGQLGASAPSPSTPVTATGISDVLAVGAGNGFTCVAFTNGTASCWGAGSEGELGDGTSPFSRATPGPVSGISTAVGLSSGDGHTCAVLTGGTVQCWGSNQTGQLGDGSSSKTSSTPVTVMGITNAKAIEATTSTTLALLQDGTATRWPPLTPVAGLTGASKITVGGCAAVASGAVCWGSNSSGQLGDGTNNPSATPVAVVGLP